MSKMANIQAQLERATGKKAAPDDTLPPTTKGRTRTTPSREGKIHIGAYLKEENMTSLLLIRAKTKKNTQELLQDALNELFRRYDVPVVGS